MESVFTNILGAVLEERESCHQIWFAQDNLTPPPFSYQVNFPRLELVLKGKYHNQLDDGGHSIVEADIMVGDALYIPPNCWNKPNWDDECSVLSLLYGKRQLGFSFVAKRAGEVGFYDVQKHSVPTRTGFAIDNILESLNALARETKRQPMGEHLLCALLSYTTSMIQLPLNGSNNHSKDLYQGICIYIQENFHRSISRESIAARFHISPNHLSRLFRQQGHMTLADYMTWVRMERAKFMLKKYQFRLCDVSTRCGYQDVNYFCRVFKTRTGMTPSQYRASM